jgi:hypothetical protein
MTEAFGLYSKLYQDSGGTWASDARKLLKTHIGTQIALQATKC